MAGKRSWLPLLLLGLLLRIGVIVMECNVCQENEVACVNSTSFYLCFGDGTPNTEAMFHCKDGFDCTDLNAICVQKNNARPPSCGDTSLCGMCSANRNYVFACLSRTTFQMCFGAIRPTGQIGFCPEGKICDANSDNICVNENGPSTVTCDIVNTIPFPTSSPTTSSTETLTPPSMTTETEPEPETTTTTTSFPLTPNQICAQKREVGLFPTMPLDPFCHRYVYCYYVNGIMNGIEYSCSGNTYFDIEKLKCTFNKPAYCI